MSERYFQNLTVQHREYEEGSDTSLPPPPSSTNVQAHARIDLVGLGHDVHHAILTELVESSPQSLPAFARVSKPFNAIATQYVYRTMILGTQPGSQYLLERLRGKEASVIVKHVWHIRVEEPIPVDVLETVLDRVGNLKTFSWNANVKIPPTVLQKLQKDWPEVELAVRNHCRLDATLREDQVVDGPLVSAAHSLDYTVWETGQKSEWALITRLLESNGSIKKLHLRSDSRYGRTVGNVMPENAPSGSSRLALTPGTRLAPLEELSLLTGKYLRYAWDSDHSLQLSTCMDWSHMRKLDFGSDYPLHLFSALAGRVPNLTSLRFGLPTAAETSGPAESLLESTMLTELDVDNIHTYMDALWPAICKHRNSLETLILRPSKRDQGYYADPPEFLDASYIKKIASKFSSLHRLGFSLPFDKALPKPRKWFSSLRRLGFSLPFDKALPKPRKRATETGENYLEALASIGSLKSLDLFLHVPFEATQFSARLTQNGKGSIRPPALDVRGTRRAASQIANKISAAQTNPLRTLTLHLGRTGMANRGHMFLLEAKMQLRRTDRDDADLMGDGKYQCVHYCWLDQVLGKAQQMLQLERAW